MNVRIVVADEREAHFFDAVRQNAPLLEKGSVLNDAAGMKDIDLETDRAGRRFGGTHGHRHGVGGERSTEAHYLTLFAKQVAERIDAGRVNHEFDKFVLVAPPKVLGLLRESLPKPSQALLAGEVSKDLVHHDADAIRGVIPWDSMQA